MLLKDWRQKIWQIKKLLYLCRNKNGEIMTLENEILGFTNWLYTNNWKLIGDGMCLNIETKAIGYINELMVEYNK